MLIVHVFVHVKPEFIAAFRSASAENARKSLLEPGIARFDVLQQADAPTRFLLMEAYRAAEDAAEHKGTKHYRVWRDTVEEMMAEPRISAKFGNVFPPDEDWG